MNFLDVKVGFCCRYRYYCASLVLWGCFLLWFLMHEFRMVSAYALFVVSVRGSQLHAVVFYEFIVSRNLSTNWLQAWFALQVFPSWWSYVDDFGSCWLDSWYPNISKCWPSGVFSQKHWSFLTLNVTCSRLCGPTTLYYIAGTTPYDHFTKTMSNSFFDRPRFDAWSGVAPSGWFKKKKSCFCDHQSWWEI